MKKIQAILLSLASLTVVSTLFISCFRFKSDYLASLPNFDWTQLNNGGDGTSYAYSYDGSQNTVGDVNSVELNEVNPDNISKFLDYSKVNTGYQYYKSIQKQAVTGVPLSKNYSFNGNKYSDYGIDYNSRTFMYKNSILDWTPNDDIDAKYLQPTVEEISKAVKVANYGEYHQDKNINFNLLSDPTIQHRSYVSNGVGAYNVYEKSILNWQSIDSYVNWGGSWFEGMVEIPNVGLTEQAHKNGKPIYGTIFMSGYNGLTRDMLRDFIKRDSSGNYLIVDKLIEMADYYGFEGYFINNESNGGKPNGSVLDYNVLFEICRQFNEKVAASKNKHTQKLELVYYNSYATLAKNSTGEYKNNETYQASKTGAVNSDGTRNPVKITLDFGSTTESNDLFLREHANYNGKSNYISTIVDVDYRNQMPGSFDYRTLTYPLSKDQEHEIDETRPYLYSSFTDFAGGEYTKYAQAIHESSKELQSRIKSSDLSEQVKSYLYLQQINNLFQNIMYSGTNGHIGDDKGLEAQTLYTLQNAKYNLDYILLDPRIKDKYDAAKYADKETSEMYQKAKSLIYEPNAAKNGYKNSYGISSLVVPTTVIQDEDGANEKLNFSTNFSTGNGVNLYNVDIEGNQHSSNVDGNYYPWTNTRLADILPTYQWNIYEGNTSNYGTADINNTVQQVGVDKLSGYYDYNNVYKKGNSISLGGGFDKDGAVVNGVWTPGKTYNWEIMGTNLATNNHMVSFVYKTNTSEENDPDVSLIVGKSPQGAGALGEEKLDTNVSEIKTTKTVEKNGWTRITADLSEVSGVSTTNRISKIGLAIKPKNADFKISVGEMTVDKVLENKSTESALLTNAASEYVIKRSEADLQKYNIRFKWDVDDADKVKYYEIYYYNPDKKIWVNVGETTNNLYFLKELIANSSNKLRIGILPYNQDDIAEKLFTFNVNV